MAITTSPSWSPAWSAIEPLRTVPITHGRSPFRSKPKPELMLARVSSFNSTQPRLICFITLIERVSILFMNGLGFFGNFSCTSQTSEIKVRPTDIQNMLKLKNGIISLNYYSLSIY
ncbi:hypothetical protein BpHYR1_041932 [Brachionus plicatilis]|uniref:Uncharacterized protein n=1 Tax=Brachionus plicatilis TaxID=10195 RepID=A0A3M7QNJ3_BRAPC|nr:hypothetical protein BpHYR1_041932 [Brachionus plicatilis]